MRILLTENTEILLNVPTGFPEAAIGRSFNHVISDHLHGTFLLKRARCVCGQNLGQNLHSLTLQVVPTYEILARQDTGGSTVGGRAMVEYQQHYIMLINVCFPSPLIASIVLQCTTYCRFPKYVGW